MCPLCCADRLTHWYYEDSGFYVCESVQCYVPMAVVRSHGEDKPIDFDVIIRKLAEVADEEYGKDNWRFDFNQRAIHDHWHCHARPI